MMSPEYKAQIRQNSEADTNTPQILRYRQAKKDTGTQTKPLRTHKCRHCGAEVSQNAEFCPCCGEKLVGYCTFCGAPMSPNDTVCEECGMPADGVRCPQCGTLNQRSFCRHCSAPLTKAAIRSIEKAKQDPRVRKVAELMDRAAELEAKLMGTRKAATEGEKRLMDLLGQKVEFVDADFNPQEVFEEYNKTVKDINQLFEEMLPPVGSTPQEQFNYYSARKVAIETTRKVQVTNKTGWVCNFCGYFHLKPSECAEPWRGGKWIYETIECEETIREYVYKD